MRIDILTMAGAALVLAACTPAETAAPPTAVAGVAEETASNGPIPGPRTCFWSRGPHSADPYINIAYPDANVFYWAAVFTVPDGAGLKIEGDYPHSRYMSFISYDERGRPIESLADYLVEPKSVPVEKLGDASLPWWEEISAAHAQDADEAQGINPFVAGNPRDSQYRRYEFTVSGDAPEAARATGERAVTASGNLLHAPAYGEARQQVILYRIYLPDEGRGPAGGVELPAPKLTLADGTVLDGADACAALNANQPLGITPDAVGIPPSQYREMLNQPGKPDTWPAQIPAKWFIQLDRANLIGIYTGFSDPEAPRSEGGFYPNLDNHYVRTIINRKHGPVFLMRGKAPTTPRTAKGDAVMGDGELRYWSICSNQGFANTRVNDCLYDEEIPLDANGAYTVVVSRAEDRPRNAVPECGIAWLPMAENGDGLFDEDVTVVQIRHMLTAPDFERSVQRVYRQDDLETTMGPYLPRSQYLLPNAVESYFPCLGDNG
ncbi:MAG: hypothetical protein RLO80_04780 [Hyphomonas sp.]